MTEKWTARDLTRWNRAGLSRVAYVDGNAASWLEELRLKFLTLYLRGAPADWRDPELWRELFASQESDWPDASWLDQLKDNHLVWRALWQSPPDAPETAETRNARLRRQYDAGHDDQTMEIARAFARALHVLTGHLDAYANEGLLRTATQWDNVRKLAALVDYVPAPPASAASEVALIAEAGVCRREVAKGLAFRYAPPDGGSPLVFETLRDVTIDAELNAMRLAGWDRNETPVDNQVDWVPAAGEPTANPGTFAVLTGGAKPIALRIDARASPRGEGALRLSFEPVPDTRGLARADARLLVDPGAPRRPRLTPGDKRDVVEVADGALETGQIVAWEVAGSVRYAVVTAVDGNRARISAEIGPEVTRLLQPTAYRAGPVDGTIAAVVPTGLGELRRVGSGGRIDVLTESGAEDDADIADGAGNAIARKVTGLADGTRVYAPARGTDPARAVRVVEPHARADASLTFDGTPPAGLSAGALLVAQAGDRIQALTVLSVSKEPDSYTVVTDSAASAEGGPRTLSIHGPFPAALVPADARVNPASAFESGPRLVLAGLSPAAARLIKPGKRLLLETQAAGAARAQLVTVGHPVAQGPAGLSVPVLEAAPDPAFERGATVVRGNVVTIGHGETKGPQVLGSGNGERAEQSFHLDVDNLSYAPDETAASGVAPALSIAVDGMLWSRVERRDEAADGAPAYLVRAREDRTLDVTFLRRLPSGVDNVRLTSHRTGRGTAGNGVPAFTFTKPAKPHPFVAGVRQPCETTGGAETEPVSAVREQAPRDLRALDRAVTVADFAAIAGGHSSVWRARADGPYPAGRGQVVEVTVVPVDGATDAPTLQRIHRFVAARTQPGVRVRIVPFEPLPVLLDLSIRVDPRRHAPDAVRRAAARHLAATFDLRGREIAAPLHRTELVAAAERVTGVETAQVVLGPAGGAPAARRRVPDDPTAPLRALFPKPKQVAFVAGPASIAVNVEEIA
jgi:hypothetical protein